ncbi:MAG: hypothetical protein AB4911_04405 [Oscillochloridaceae bacterium umkhey_bin13]
MEAPALNEVGSFTADQSAPNPPLILSPTEASSIGPRPTIGGRAIGTTGGTVTVRLNDTTICIANIANDSSWSCTLTADLPIFSNQQMRATVTNEAGNTSSEAVRTFSVVPGLVATPAFIAPLNVATPKPTIGGIADAGANITLTVTLQNDFVVMYNTPVSNEGRWQVDLATATPAIGTLPTGGLTNGNHVLLALATNSLGVESLFSIANLVVNLPPPVFDNMTYLPLVVGLAER